MKMLPILAAAFVLAQTEPTKVKFDSSQTFNYGQEVSVQGKLQVGEFFGPPGFGADLTKDKIERFFYLQLPSSIRVANGGGGPDLPFSFIQLIVRDPAKLPAPMRDSIGRKVEVLGKLVPRSGPRNHTSALVEVASFRPLENWE